MFQTERCSNSLTIWQIIGFIIILVIVMIIAYIQNIQDETMEEYFISDISYPVYVINLDHRADRWNRIDNMLIEIKKTYNVNRWSAINGKELDISQLENKYNIKLSNDKLTRGEIGCFLTHRDIWKYIVDNNISYAVILEDDVILDFDLIKKISKGLKKIIPDNWDFLYLDRNYHEENEIIVNSFTIDKKNDTVNVTGTILNDQEYYGPKLANKMVTANILSSESQQYKLVKAKVSYGLQAYIISLKGAKILLEKCNIISKPIDVLIGDYLDNMNSYAIDPRLGNINNYNDSDTQSIK